MAGEPAGFLRAEPGGVTGPVPQKCHGQHDRRWRLRTLRLVAERCLVSPNPPAIIASTDAIATDAPVRPLSLRLNFSWVLAGNLIRSAARYGMLLLLAYSCGLAAAGRYAIAIAICNPIWALVMLGLRGSQITDARREFALADYLGLRLVASGVGLVLVAGAVMGQNADMKITVVITLVTLARLIEGISDVFRGRFQQHERMDRIAIGLIVQGMSGLVLMLLVHVLGGGELWMVAAFPLAMALTLLCWDIPCQAALDRVRLSEEDGNLWRQPLNWARLGRLGLTSLPLAMAAFLISVVPQLPKYSIASLLGSEAVAVYTMIGYWIALGTMVVSALGNVIAPRLARYHAEGSLLAFSRLLVQIVSLVAGMGVAGVVLVALLGPVAASLLGQADSDLPRLAVALSLFATVLYVTAPLGRALAAMRKFWVQTLAMSAGVLAAAIILPWAIKTRGLVGAAEAMAVSMGVVALLEAGVIWFQLSARTHCKRTPVKEAA